MKKGSLRQYWAQLTAPVTSFLRFGSTLSFVTEMEVAHVHRRQIISVAADGAVD